jgi:drug/metabolite transporter (DMT)-like permease
MLQLLLYFLALASLSTSPNWAKLNQMPPEVLGFWRLAIAAVALFLFQKIYKKQPLIHNKSASKWILGSGFLFFLHLWTYKYAAKHTLVSLTVILFSTTPIWTAIFNVFAFREKITKRMIISFVIAFTGVFILSKDQLHYSAGQTLGNLSALVSALFCALYLVTSKKARQSVTNLNFAILQYGVCAVFFFLATLFTDANLIKGTTMISWISVIGLVAVPTLLGHFLISSLMNKMNLAVMTCGKLIEPVMASVIAYYLFQEKLGAMTYLAFLCTSIAILNLFWPQISHYFKKINSVNNL